MTGEEYVEAVLALVERIPPGRVMSYGAIADYLAERSGRASPRQVGSIMARYGGGVPWHRVVTTSGRLPPGHEVEARARLLVEGAPLRGSGVDIRAAAWQPEPDGADPDGADPDGADPDGADPDGADPDGADRDEAGSA